jgi:Flp pilus assembly protein CpaB
MIIALACGLGAAYLAWRYVAAKEGEDPEIEVLVPKQEIPPMTRLNKADLFEKVMVKEKSLRDKADVIKSFEDLQDPKDKSMNYRTRNFPLQAKRPFYRADIALHKESDLGARLGPDDVMVTIHVNPQEAGFGLINPGDRVDIIAPIYRPGALEPEFRIVFQNVEVLSVNSSKEPQPDGSPQPPTAINLKVDRNTAEHIIAYKSRGNLSVLLRKPDHAKTYATKGAKPSEVPGQASSDVAQEKPNENRTPMDPSVPLTQPSVDVAEIEKKVKAEYEARLEEQNKRLKEALAKIEELTKQPAPTELKEEPTVHETKVINGSKVTTFRTLLTKEKPAPAGGTN